MLNLIGWVNCVQLIHLDLTKLFLLKDSSTKLDMHMHFFFLISVKFFDGLQKLNLRHDYRCGLIYKSFLNRACLNIESSA